MNMQIKHRQIRSYVLRAGRLTPGQRRAIDKYFPRYGLNLPPANWPRNLLPITQPPDNQPINFATEFGNNAPLHLEIGFGDGDALVNMARQNLHNNYIGIEVHPPGVGRLLSQLHAADVNNVRVFWADAVQVLSVAIAPVSLAAIYIYFPDPWPKKRHHKRRLIQDDVVALLANRLQIGGMLYFATDDADYAYHALAKFESCAELKNCAAAGCFSPRLTTRPMTKFEQRGLKMGSKIWDISMQKQSSI